MKRLSLVLATTLWVVTAAPAWAQAAAANSDTPAPIVLFQEEAASKDVFSFDYAVPGSPALALLGLDAGARRQ